VSKDCWYFHVFHLPVLFDPERVSSTDALRKCFVNVSGWLDFPLRRTSDKTSFHGLALGTDTKHKVTLAQVESSRRKTFGHPINITPTPGFVIEYTLSKAGGA
jgi:hypothetical protein